MSEEIDKVNFQGENAEALFSGKGQGTASRLLYSESAALFSKLIQGELQPGNYTLADLGGHKGEFLNELISLTPKYNFNSTIVDIVEGIHNSSNTKKILTDIAHTPFGEKSIDIVIARYVLAWNTLDKQKEILSEIIRICKGICIIQHQGSDVDEKLLFQEDFGKAIPEMMRSTGVFTNPTTIDRWLTDLDVRFEKVQNRKIDNLSDIAIEKYNLNTEKADAIRKLLKGRDYILQTTWLLKFN